jgi:hypothetical protein
MGGRGHPVRRNSRPLSGLLSMSMQIKESEELRTLPSPSPGSERGMERSPAARRVALERTPSSQQLLPTIVSGKNHSFLDLPNHSGEDTSPGTILSPINSEGNCDR